VSRTLEWYSASLKYAVLIETVGTSTMTRSVVLVRAHDWTEGRAKALETGRSHETTYLNGDGKQVRWALVAIETLDCLGPLLEDGREVYYEPRSPAPDEDYAFDTSFCPQDSEPGQTGV
jgi:hypothetical protein